MRMCECGHEEHMHDVIGCRKLGISHVCPCVRFSPVEDVHREPPCSCGHRVYQHFKRGRCQQMRPAAGERATSACPCGEYVDARVERNPCVHCGHSWVNHYASEDEDSTECVLSVCDCDHFRIDLAQLKSAPPEVLVSETNRLPPPFDTMLPDTWEVEDEYGTTLVVGFYVGGPGKPAIGEWGQVTIIRTDGSKHVQVGRAKHVQVGRVNRA